MPALKQLNTWQHWWRGYNTAPICVQGLSYVFSLTTPYLLEGIDVSPNLSVIGLTIDGKPAEKTAYRRIIGVAQQLGVHTLGESDSHSYCVLTLRTRWPQRPAEWALPFEPAQESYPHASTIRNSPQS